MSQVPYKQRDLATRLSPSVSAYCKRSKTGGGEGLGMRLVWLQMVYWLYITYVCSAVPSSPPQDLVVVAWSSTILHLTWAPPPRENQNGLIRGYRINVTELETGRVFYFFSPTASKTIPNLHPAYNYTCVVAAFTVGDGPGVTGSIRLLEDG